MMCGKCGKSFAVIVLVIGVLFLLQDLAIWNFWNLSWYTVAFLLFGVTGIGHASCSQCCAMPKKKK